VSQSSRTLSPTAAAFIDSVLALQPQVVAFDCDGTLWKNDSGMDFMHWEIEHKLLPDDVARWMIKRYEAYLAGRVAEEVICGEMVQIHRGLKVKDITAVARQFFGTVVEGNIFPEMLDLIGQLKKRGCEIWAVSSTCDWVIIEGMKRFGIPAERVLASAVKVKEGIATDELLQVPSGEGKACALRRVLTHRLDVAFGNSIHDVAMLEIAEHRFPVNPTPELAVIANQRGWQIYHPRR
jgi:HAD superfamily phosphoserine phosphatase-like hydrolase